MGSLPLSVKDVREILSSLLLAGLSYDDRMRFSKGASLLPDFKPNRQHLPELDRITQSIRAMFGTPAVALPFDTTLHEWADELHCAWQETEKQITFFTSGSTGEPKPTTHDYRLLEQEVHALAAIFSNRKRIVSFVPRHHIYGFLFSILLPKALNCDVCWEVPLPTPGLIHSLGQGDLIVAFPLLWKKFSEMEVRFNSDVNGVTSTGPCPADVINNLRSNGLGEMYEVYGSSETGGIGYRTSPGGHYSLLSHWKRSIDPASLERTHPAIGAQTYGLQDNLQWETDTTFIPTKRMDDAVQVAGINVYPSRVRDVLAEHPDVRECAVRLMRQEEGTRLKAIVVPMQTGNTMNETEAALRKWAKERLTVYEMPGSWTFARKLPLNEMGKLKDW